MSIFLNKHRTIKLKKDRDYIIDKQGYAILKNVNYHTVWIANHTKLRVTGSLNVKATDQTKVISFDNVTVSLSENAQCIANNNTKISVWTGNPLVFAYDNSKIKFKRKNKELSIKKFNEIYKEFKKTGNNFSKVDKLFKEIIKDIWIFDNSKLADNTLDSFRQFMNY
jgi:hypothetical protein